MIQSHLIIEWDTLFLFMQDLPFWAIVPRHMVAFLLTTLSSDMICLSKGSKAPKFNNSCLFSSPTQPLKNVICIAAHCSFENKGESMV